MKKRKRIISLFVTFMLIFCVMVIPVNASSTNTMNEDVQEKFDPTAHGKVVQSGNCGAAGSNVQYRLYEDGMLYIYGRGEMSIISDSPWRNCKKLYIEDGVTKIGKNSFYKCEKLNEVRIPKNLSIIDEYAFAYCISLTNIELPTAIKDINDATFFDCENLVNIVIPNGVEFIAQDSFALCKKLKTITIPKSVTTIASSAFTSHYNIIIKGEKGSYAETYANENGFYFRDINDNTVYLSIDDLYEGQLISKINGIEKSSSYSRYEVEYYNKYDEKIRVDYSKPNSSIKIESIDNIDEWEIKELGGGYGILNINGEISQGHYALIRLIDPLYKEVPEPTTAPTPIPTSEPTPVPIPTQEPIPTIAPTTSPTQEPHPLNGWATEEGKEYWYENGVRQGYDPNNSAYRGKEIYDKGTDAWYWLDNVQQGAKAVSKDVYQESQADDAGNIGKWVRYDANGHMVKGWDYTNKGIFYFDLVYGTMYKGYKTIDGVTYYFDENTGVTDRKPINSNTSNANGWVTIDGKEYWYENGVRQGTEGRGREIYDPNSNAWYWLDAVQGGAKTVNKDVYQESSAGQWAEKSDGTGKWVRYDENGHMIKGWNYNNTGTYYFDPTYGTMAKGIVTIDGKTYHFDEVTGALK